MMRPRNLEPLLIAVGSISLVVILWSSYRIDDLMWQSRRNDSLRAELVAKRRQLVASGTLSLTPAAQKQFAALIDLLESDDNYERRMLESRAELSRYLFFCGLGIFAIQVAVGLLAAFRGPRRETTL